MYLGKHQAETRASGPRVVTNSTHQLAGLDAVPEARAPESPTTQLAQASPNPGPHPSALRLAPSGVAGAWPLLARASTEAWALTKRALSQATASTAREGHNGVSFQHSDSNVSTCPSCPLPISSRERGQRVSRLSSSFNLLFPDFKFPSRRLRSPLHVHDDRQLTHQSLIN